MSSKKLEWKTNKTQEDMRAELRNRNGKTENLGW